MTVDMPDKPWKEKSSEELMTDLNHVFSTFNLEIAWIKKFDIGICIAVNSRDLHVITKVYNAIKKDLEDIPVSIISSY